MIAPVEIFTLADRYGLYRMESRLVFGQDQDPSVVTSRLRILACINVPSRLIDGIRLLLTIQGVLPVVRMGSIQYTVLYKLATRMLNDRDCIDGVSAQDIRIDTRIAVRTTVERHTLIIAKRERDSRVDLLCHMQTVDTVALMLRVVDTLIDTWIGDRRILPCVTLAFLQTLVLVFLETRIEGDHIRGDAVLVRIRHVHRVVQDR